MARETYSGGTILSSATATPAVVATGSRLRVRYVPSGPSASILISPAASVGCSRPTEAISVDAFNDRLAFEGGDGPHLAERITNLAVGARHPDGAVAFQVVRDEHALADLLHHHLTALSVRHFVAGIGIHHREDHIGCARIENERVTVATSASDRLRKNHGAAEHHGDRRMREDFAEQIQRIEVHVSAAEQHEADLLVHQLDHVVVAGNGLEQWWGGVQIRHM